MSQALNIATRYNRSFYFVTACDGGPYRHGVWCWSVSAYMQHAHVICLSRHSSPTAPRTMHPVLVQQAHIMLQKACLADAACTPSPSECEPGFARFSLHDQSICSSCLLKAWRSMQCHMTLTWNVPPVKGSILTIFSAYACAKHFVPSTCSRACLVCRAA